MEQAGGYRCKGEPVRGNFGIFFCRGSRHSCACFRCRPGFLRRCSRKCTASAGNLYWSVCCERFFIFSMCMLTLALSSLLMAVPFCSAWCQFPGWEIRCSRPCQLPREHLHACVCDVHRLNPCPPISYGRCVTNRRSGPCV